MKLGCGFHPRTGNFQLIVILISLHDGRYISTATAERRSQVEQQYGLIRIHPEFNTCDKGFPSDGECRKGNERYCTRKKQSVRTKTNKASPSALLVCVMKFSIFFFPCHFPFWRSKQSRLPVHYQTLRYNNLGMVSREFLFRK